MLTKPQIHFKFFKEKSIFFVFIKVLTRVSNNLLIDFTFEEAATHFHLLFNFHKSSILGHVILRSLSRIAIFFKLKKPQIILKDTKLSNYSWIQSLVCHTYWEIYTNNRNVRIFAGELPYYTIQLLTLL